MKSMWRVPYYGALALLRPQQGEYVAALSEITGDSALRHVLQRLKGSASGQKLLRDRPIISKASISFNSLAHLPRNTLGRKYYEYMSHHNFSADERPSVKHVEDDELAYVVLRYRQVHDFWHVLADLPPTILGEVALKCFEWRITGLPSCGMAAVAGPLRLSYQERNTLLVQYIPWALRSATECEDLMAYPYEKHLHRTVEDIREELNLEPAPK